MGFNVTFSNGDLRNYADKVVFSVADNGVLVITDGDDVIHYAPHVWSEIRSTKPPLRNDPLSRLRGRLSGM